MSYLPEGWTWFDLAWNIALEAKVWYEASQGPNEMCDTENRWLGTKATWARPDGKRCTYHSRYMFQRMKIWVLLKAGLINCTQVQNLMLILHDPIRPMTCPQLESEFGPLTEGV